MKKGFTMIELIFVIVILGILASVAIPRLAATRTDAEIATTVANLRTLLIDLNSYYVVKGKFADGVKWSEITNVPLENADTQAVGDNGRLTGRLMVGGKSCIEISIHNRTPRGLPAYIKFTKYPTYKDKGVCKEVLEAKPIKAFVDSKILDALPGTMAIGSSTITD